MGTRLPQAAQQLGGRFLAGVLRHQLAAKGLGQQRGREALGSRAGGLQAGFQPIGIGEQDFYAAALLHKSI